MQLALLTDQTFAMLFATFTLVGMAELGGDGSGGGGSLFDPNNIISTTRDLLREGGMKGLLTVLLGGTFTTIAFNFWEFINSISETFFQPLRALASGIASLITGTFGGPVIINEAGAQQAARSITDGLVANFGPLAFPIAVASSMLGIYVFSWFWSRMSLSPLGYLRSLRR